MARLSVNLSGWERAFEGPLQAPAVVEVHGPDHSLVDRGVLHVNRREAQLRLGEPGPHEVRVILPSGQVLTQGFVYRNQPVPPLEFDLYAISPYDSLQRVAMVQRLASSVASDLRAPAFVSTWVQLWERTGGQWHPVPPPLEVEGSEWLSDAVRYRLRLERRQYVLQIGGPAVPWKLICLPATGFADLVVQPAGPQSAHPLELTAVSGSTAADALLGYLSRGAIPAATSLVEQEPQLAELMLRNKLRDPYTAAIGGYYLLRIGDIEERMRSWPANLANWMDWMSDGPIIRGWQLLKGARPREDETARDRFLQAVERGLPVYAEGLRLLIDGLKVIGRKARWKDRDVQGALEQIGRYGAATDWSRPILTFTGSAPDRPDALAPIGFPEARDELVFLHSMTVGDLINHGLVRPGTSWDLKAQPTRQPRAERLTATVTPAGMMGTYWEYPTPEAAMLFQLFSTTDAWEMWRRADGLTLADLREQAHRQPRAVRQEERPASARIAATVGSRALDRPTDSPHGQEPYNSIESLVQAMRGELARTALGIIGDQADIDDVLQNTYLQLTLDWRSAGSLRTSGDQRAYLLKAVRNEALQLIGRPYLKREDLGAEVAESPPAEESLDEQVQARQVLGRLGRAISKLPVKRRDVMRLYVAGYEYAEIAEMLSMPVSTVRSHISEARRQLRLAAPDAWEDRLK
jgi:RNA polymerase sigma factor (sigma-70 family)